MKSILFITLLLSCAGSTKVNADHPLPHSCDFNNKVELNKLFTLEDAASIVGEKVVTKDSTLSRSKNWDSFQSSYEAVEKSDRVGNVYFVVFRYISEDMAKKSYTDIRETNKSNGIEDLKKLGDRAYFHTDNSNFYFIMVQSGNCEFRIKVNKITTKTSKANFMKVAEKIEGLISKT